jgi:putative copper export protein
VSALSVIHWPQPITEYIGFIGEFLPAGAIGFRYAVLRGALARAHASTESTTLGRVYDDAARRAAIVGLIGIVVALCLLFYQLPGLGARRHLTASQVLATNHGVQLQLGFMVLALIGFALAMARGAIGWPLATVGFLAELLRNGLLGQWRELANPLHVLAGGLWIGTLFVMIVAGISAVLRDEPAREHRGVIVSDMVNTFSPLALVAAGALVLFGVIIAWEHLHVLSNLWRSAYGIALIIKLCFVAIVFTLGAWNWRRQKPLLGTEPAALAIRRSAVSEVSVAAVVLVMTAILLSIPAPRVKKPGPPATGPGGAPLTAPTAAPGTSAGTTGH